MKKIISITMLILGALAAMTFLTFRHALPVPAAVALKAVPALFMGSWVLARTRGKAGGAIMAVGLLCSMLCDVFMELHGGNLWLFGLAANFSGLLLYILYFLRDDRAPRWGLALPGGIAVVTIFMIIEDGTGAMAVPVLVYCLLYGVLLWRAAARQGNPKFSRREQLLALTGSAFLVASDGFLSLTMFKGMPFDGKNLWTIMICWWGGLLCLALMAAAGKTTKTEENE